MNNSPRNCVELYQNKVFDELYYANTLVNMTRKCCMEREFKGEYYEKNNNRIKMLSEERNEYIAMLTLISDKISHITKLNLNIEQELCLQEDANNSCR